MNKVRLTGAALAIGAAAMFSVAPVFAEDAATAPMVSCKGVNSCKSASNSCKGQAIVQMTQEDCTKAGGTVADDASQQSAAESEGGATQQDGATHNNSVEH